MKSVFPNTIVIVHHDNAIHDNTWFYQAFQTNGGKFDMIGLSHYPDWDLWESSNTTAATNLRKLWETFGKPIMIVETGYSNWDEARAEDVMKDLFSKMQAEEGCAGILYWEPEVYGGWNARQLLSDGTWQDGTNGRYGVKVTNHGAFNEYGQPAPALLAFGTTTGINLPTTKDESEYEYFNIQGQKINKHTSGLMIIKKGTYKEKILNNKSQGSR